VASTGTGAAPAPAAGLADGNRPLRSDAERNRRRILRAAAEVFTERRLDATLDDVARHAGVGVGTVYRRFPDKDALVEELFTERIDALVRDTEKACAAPDPWTGLTWYLEHVAETFSGDIGFRQMMMFGTHGAACSGYARDRMRPVVTRLVERAQAAGHVRRDLSPTDIPFILLMVTSTAEHARDVNRDVWRRYLALVLDGLRPARCDVTPLGVPALDPDETARAFVTHGRRLAARRKHGAL
jgi:AcrR family transcriptional regulator